MLHVNTNGQSISFCRFRFRFCFRIFFFFLLRSTALNGLVIFDVSDFINSFCFPISEFMVLIIACTDDYFPVSAKALYSGGHDACEQEADFISDWFLPRLSIGNRQQLGAICSMYPGFHRLFYVSRISSFVLRILNVIVGSLFYLVDCRVILTKNLTSRNPIIEFCFRL